jgi:large subunit ribosomal protein L18
MNTQKQKQLVRARRVRAHIKSVARPRLSVNRSNAHIWAQIIDDQTGRTLCAGSDQGLKGTKTARAAEVGKRLGEAAVAQKIKAIVFDRGSYRYHGRVKSLAEAARAAGLEF